jgi:predicted HicB family RNase H-like nuclease
MIKTTTIRPPEDLHNILRDAARKNGYTLNGFILQILWDWVKAQENKNNPT